MKLHRKILGGNNSETESIGGKHLNKEESLAFLQNCIEKVKRATAQDIQFYKEVYDREYAYKEKCLRTKEIKK